MGEVIRQVRHESWTVMRTAVLEEVYLPDRNITRYHVTISDEGRKPFIARWFNDPVPAHDLMDRIMGGVDPRKAADRG